MYNKFLSIYEINKFRSWFLFVLHNKKETAVKAIPDWVIPSICLEGFEGTWGNFFQKFPHKKVLSQKSAPPRYHLTFFFNTS